jgi:type IV/VI secretion system ImpK/VasF family protein
MANKRAPYLAETEHFSRPYLEFMALVLAFLRARNADAEILKKNLCRSLDEIQFGHGAGRGALSEASDAALFAVCAWADERIMNAGWDEVSTQWPQMLLQTHYFQTNLAGEAFFERLQSLSSNAGPAYSVFAFCLSLGFEGRYVSNLAVEDLDQKRQSTFETALARAGLSEEDIPTFPSVAMLIKPPRMSSFRWLAMLLIASALGGLGALTYWYDNQINEKLIDLERGFRAQTKVGPTGHRAD